MAVTPYLTLTVTCPESGEIALGVVVSAGSQPCTGQGSALLSSDGGAFVPGRQWKNSRRVTLHLALRIRKAELERLAGRDRRRPLQGRRRRLGVGRIRQGQSRQQRQAESDRQAAGHESQSVPSIFRLPRAFPSRRCRSIGRFLVQTVQNHRKRGSVPVFVRGIVCNPGLARGRRVGGLLGARNLPLGLFDQTDGAFAVRADGGSVGGVCRRVDKGGGLDQMGVGIVELGIGGQGGQRRSTSPPLPAPRLRRAPRILYPAGLISIRSPSRGKSGSDARYPFTRW